VKWFSPLEVTLPTCPAVKALSSRERHRVEMSSIYWRQPDSQEHKRCLQGLAGSLPTWATCTQQPRASLP